MYTSIGEQKVSEIREELMLLKISELIIISILNKLIVGQKMEFYECINIIVIKENMIVVAILDNRFERKS